LIQTLPKEIKREFQDIEREEFIISCQLRASLQYRLVGIIEKLLRKVIQPQLFLLL